MIGFGWGRFRPEIGSLRTTVNQQSLMQDWRKELLKKFVLAPLAGRLEQRWEVDG
jgi:hypothetical protein